MDEILSTLLEHCKSSGLRKTKPLMALLETLIKVNAPVTLSELIESPLLHEQCDKVTVYRLLQRLGEKGIVRRLGLHERSAYFILLLPDNHKDFLICTKCNHIEPIEAPCPVHALEQEIATKSGYQGLFHELEFFGVCPDCALN